MPSLCRTPIFSCDNFSFVSAILVQLEVEQAEMSREATCQTGEHKEEFLIDARTNSFFFYTLRFTFNRVAGNKKAGPNYGDINRCNNWLKKKLPILFSLPCDLRHDNKPVRRGARQEAGKKGDFWSLFTIFVFSICLNRITAGQVSSITNSITKWKSYV